MKPMILVPGSAKRFLNYRRAIEFAGGRAVFAEDWRDADGLLLPGGGDVAPERYGQKNFASRGIDLGRDALELFLIEQFLGEGRPILGICRGMQVLNVFFGGTLLQDIPGHGQAGTGTDRLHRTVVIDSELKRLYGKGQMIVNSAHHQAVDQLGKGLRAVQWSADGSVEAIEHATLPVWGVQWHPERLCGAMTKRGAADGRLLFGEYIRRCK